MIPRGSSTVVAARNPTTSRCTSARTPIYRGHGFNDSTQQGPKSWRGWIVSGSCVPTLPVLGSLARVRSPSQVVGHSVIHQDLCKDSHCTPEHPILDYDEEKQTCICRSLDMFQIHLGGYLENKGSRLWQRKFLSRSAASMMFEP